MSERSRQRRLYVTNRLEELRSKYGHEDGWFPLESEASGVGSVGGGTIDPAPLPSQQRSASGGVTPPAGPGQEVLGTLEL